jgi:hypothetical protein
MEKVKVGSLDDMEVKWMGSNGRACFGCGRHESGAQMLKQHWTDLARGYLAPHKVLGLL